MNKAQMVNSVLHRFGLQISRTADREEKPWDHTFRKGIEEERVGGDPNAAVEDAWGKPGWVEYILPHVFEGMSVCEVGPGVGRWTRHVLDKAKRAYLVDYSKLVCEYWQNKADDRIVSIQSLNTRIPQIPDQTVDLFMSFDVFVHLDIEPFYGYLQEAFRILKPGGVGLVDYLSLDDRSTAIWFLRELEKQDTFGDTSCVKRSIFRVHHQQSIRLLAEALGFKTDNIEDRWGSHNICVLRKP